MHEYMDNGGVVLAMTQLWGYLWGMLDKDLTGLGWNEVPLELAPEESVHRDVDMGKMGSLADGAYMVRAMVKKAGHVWGMAAKGVDVQGYRLSAVSRMIDNGTKVEITLHNLGIMDVQDAGVEFMLLDDSGVPVVQAGHSHTFDVPLDQSGLHFAAHGRMRVIVTAGGGGKDDALEFDFSEINPKITKEKVQEAGQ